MRSAMKSRSVRLRAFGLAVIFASVTAACSWGSPGTVVVGSGDVTSQTRPVAQFTEVQASAGIRLELATGPRQVVITAQPNIIDNTTTQLSGSRLIVDAKSGYVTAHGVIVKVTAPGLTAIELSGGASASGAVGTPENLVLRMSGGARATLSGSTGNLELDADGGAIPDLGTLRATNATVDLSGGVVATLDVKGSLKGSASGGVVLTLVSQPAKSDVQTSGGAVVRNR